jgi:hypothetical protein
MVHWIQFCCCLKIQPLSCLKIQPVLFKILFLISKEEPPLLLGGIWYVLRAQDTPRYSWHRKWQGKCNQSHRMLGVLRDLGPRNNLGQWTCSSFLDFNASSTYKVAQMEPVCHTTKPRPLTYTRQHTHTCTRWHVQVYEKALTKKRMHKCMHACNIRMHACTACKISILYLNKKAACRTCSTCVRMGPGNNKWMHIKWTPRFQHASAFPKKNLGPRLETLSFNFSASRTRISPNFLRAINCNDHTYQYAKACKCMTFRNTCSYPLQKLSWARGR